MTTNATLAGRLSPAALEALAEVSLLLSRQLDLEPLLRQITDAVAALIGAHNVVLWQTEHSTRQLVRRAWTSHASIPSVEIPKSLGFDEGGTGWVATQREVLFIADVGADARIIAADWAMRYDLVGFYGMPLVAGDDLVGVLTVNLTRGHRLRKDDELLLSAFAAQAAVAIRNANLFREAASRGHRLRRVADLARSVSSALELEAVLSQVTAAAIDLRADLLCIIRLVDREAGGYRLAGMGGGAADGRVQVLPFGQGLTHAVAETRKAVLVTDTRRDPRTAANAWYAAMGRTVYYGVPIVAGDELLGVMNVNFPTGAAPTADEREAIDLFASQAAVAIRNASLFAESETRRRAAEALADVGGALSRALDPDAVARQIAESVRALFAAQSSALYRLDTETGGLRALALTGHMGLGGDSSHAVLRGTPLIGLAVRERAPVSSPDLLHDPRLELTPDERARIDAPCRSGLAVPLVHKNAVIGALAVGDREGRMFTPEEIRLAQTFGDQAALALENARLYEQTRQRLLQVDSVREVIEQILVPFSLEERLTLVARKAAALFDADRAVVALLDEGTLTIRAGHALSEGELGMTVPMDVGAVGLAALRGEGVLVNDYQAWPARRPHHPAALSSIIASPLLIRGEVIGTLSVGFTRPGRRVTPADLERLATLAAPAALAIEHSRLYEQLEARLAELRDTQAQLVQAGKLSAVGQLVSGVAHELNNPLSVVIGYGQLLLRKEAPPTMTKALESIVVQAERMAKIVQSLLLFARQRKAERLPVPVGDILERTVALRATQLRLSGVAIELERVPELPAVLGDGQQLQQVFLNLLLNAEQAILEHRTGDRIEVGAQAAEGPGGTEVRAWVRDNGPGIPPDVLPRIFEPFFTTKQIGSGTGLGLSVSYGIVEQHGGHIDVESRPGATTFTVVLPVTAERTPAPVVAEAPPPAAVGTGRRALVVDDEVPVADMVATLLRETGWTVEIATSAQAGLDRIGQGRYDLIVSDIRMPDGDGESFYRTVVAAHPELARRFLIITGDTANAAAWMFLAQTGLPALEKPFAPAAFFRAVEGILVPP